MANSLICWHLRNRQRTLKITYILQRVNTSANTAMDAENSIFDHSTNSEIFEDLTTLMIE